MDKVSNNTLVLFSLPYLEQDRVIAIVLVKTQFGTLVLAASLAANQCSPRVMYIKSSSAFVNLHSDRSWPWKRPSRRCYTNPRDKCHVRYPVV